MEIVKKSNSDTICLKLIGRLDTINSPIFEKEINALDGIKVLLIDFEQLEYISSAGLRVLLNTQKKMNKVGKMVLQHVSKDIMDIFEMTGFVDILSIE